LDDRGNAIFQDAAVGDRAVVVAAADGFAPVVRRVRIGNAATVDIERISSFAATARLKCDLPVDGVTVHATFAPKDLPWLQIPRATTVGRDGTIHVHDVGTGTESS